MIEKEGEFNLQSCNNAFFLIAAALPMNIERTPHLDKAMWK